MKNLILLLVTGLSIFTNAQQSKALESFTKGQIVDWFNTEATGLTCCKSNGKFYTDIGVSSDGAADPDSLKTIRKAIMHLTRLNGAQ